MTLDLWSHHLMNRTFMLNQLWLKFLKKHAYVCHTEKQLCIGVGFHDVALQLKPSLQVLWLAIHLMLNLCYTILGNVMQLFYQN